MVIDWFTVGAQILNFLVLVWLLKRFLYQPVLDVIAKREKRIAASIADATASKAQSANERDALRAKSDAFDGERAALLAKATQNAADEGKRLTEVARKAAEALKQKHHKAMASDAKSLGAELSRLVETEVFAIARRTLADLADVTLEERISDLFIGKLGALKGAAKSAAVKMVGSSAQPPVIRSAFDLPAKQHASIQKAINEAFGSTIDLRFETAPELISGIELVAGGQKLAWNISDYLKTLEQSVADITKPDGAAAKGTA